MSNPVWKLKILSGPHLGTVLELPPGKTTVGSDDRQADLVLSNENLSSVLLSFEVTGEGALYIALVAEPMDVVINGNKEANWPVEIQGSATISTQAVDLAVVSDDAPWPDHQPERSRVQNGQSGFNEASGPESIRTASTDTGARKTTSSMVLSSGFKSFSIRAAARKLWILLVVLSVLWLSWLLLSEDEADTGSELALSPVKQSQQVVRQLHLPWVELKWNRKLRRVQLRGYVQTRSEKAALLSELKRRAIRYKSRIRVMENIVRSVEFALEELGFSKIDVMAGSSPGTVLLVGYEDDRTHWPELERILAQDIPGLKSWKADFSRYDDRVRVFGSMLEKSGLKHRLQLQGSGDSIKALGLLNEQQERLFYQVAESFRQLYGFTPELMVSPRVLPAGRLPLRATSLGDPPFLVLEDDQKYLVGAVLPNGYRIKAITREGVTLVKDNDTVFFPATVGESGRGETD